MFLYQYVGRCFLSQLYIKKTDPNLAHPLFTTLYVNLKCSYKIEHWTLVKSGPSHKIFSYCFNHNNGWFAATERNPGKILISRVVHMLKNPMITPRPPNTETLRMQMCRVECKCKCGFLVNANVDFLPLPCKCAVTVRSEGRWVEIITGKCLRQIHKFSRNSLNFDPSIIRGKV